MEQGELAKACREFADFLESRDFGKIDFTTPTFLIRAETPAEFKKYAKAMGSFKKSADQGYFNATRFFGEIKLELYIVRDLVCKRIEKGMRIIPGEPARVIPATEDRFEPMYEYECPDTILGLDEAISAAEAGLDKAVEEGNAAVGIPKAEELEGEGVPF